MTHETIKLLLEEKTYKNLTKYLARCERSTSRGDIEKAYDALRSYLADIFTLKTISQFPNDILYDFAETLQGLYLEKDDLEDYIFHILNYLTYQIDKINKDSATALAIAQRALRRKNIDDLSKLDINYKAWTYNYGYHKQAKEMYFHLVVILERILEYDKSLKQ